MTQQVQREDKSMAKDVLLKKPMTRDVLLKHARLVDYCDGGCVDTVKRMLEDKDFDICYDSGACFVFPLGDDQGLALLLVLLDYADQTKVDKKKLAEAIASAGKKIREMPEGTNKISDAAQERIAPYLRFLETISEESEGVTISTTASKLSSIEACVHAARVGDLETIRKHLDISNRGHKLMIISTAVQHNQEDIITTLVDMSMSSTDKSKAATVMRAAGDIYTQNGLFQKAEEYYNKSFELHPKYYVTFSKLGALYQHWSHECTSAADKTLLTQKAIESYNMALTHKPHHIQYGQVQEKLDTINKQLEVLRSASHSEDDSDIASASSIEELLAYSSGEETEDGNTISVSDDHTSKEGHIISTLLGEQHESHGEI